jgi:hypothetical protein
VSVELDYPSQRAGMQNAPEPMLLDTCAVQHLDTVMGRFDDDSGLSHEEAQRLVARYGPRLGPEIVALGDLVAIAFENDGPPWAVSETSLIELGRLEGNRGNGLRRSWWDWRYYWDGWADVYPEIDHAGLMWPRAVVPPEQLALFPIAPTMPDAPLDAIRHAGDRALIRDAIRAGIPAILTTDLRSFWAKRGALLGYGLEVWRPTDVWRAYGGLPIAAAPDPFAR